MHFSNNKEPTADDKVVYIDGSFDLLHCGHIAKLKEAKKRGTFLYAGVYSDETVSQIKGDNYPILSLHERVLMCLANKYVDDVIISAPYKVTEDLIKSLNIKKVVQTKEPVFGEDPYSDAKKMGIFEEIAIDVDMTIETIAERVVANREKYKQKYEKKKIMQDKYNDERQFVEEIGK